MKIIAAVLLILIGVWGGSWLIATLPLEYHFAAFATGGLLYVIGFGFFAAHMVALEEKNYTT